MGRLTTHVLDTALGRPARGVPIRLYRLGGEGGEDRALLAEAVTNEDGRCDGPVLEGERFGPGTYEIEFLAGDYLAATAGASRAGGGAPFLATIPIRFGVAAADEHYHVPLLLSPFGYCTYRGS